MTSPTPINSQITDAVAQSLLATLGTAPQVATAAQQQAFVHALGLAMHNAVNRQQLGQTLADALLASHYAAPPASADTKGD